MVFITIDQMFEYGSLSLMLVTITATYVMTQKCAMGLQTERGYSGPLRQWLINC